MFLSGPPGSSAFSQTILLCLLLLTKAWLANKMVSFSAALGKKRDLCIAVVLFEDLFIPLWANQRGHFVCAHVNPI